MSQGNDETVERVIGNWWNFSKPPEMPLWWCLREDLKQQWRDAATADDSVSMPAELSEMLSAIPTLRAKED